MPTPKWRERQKSQCAGADAGRMMGGVQKKPALRRVAAHTNRWRWCCASGHARSHAGQVSTTSMGVAVPLSELKQHRVVQGEIRMFSIPSPGSRCRAIRLSGIAAAATGARTIGEARRSVRRFYAAGYEAPDGGRAFALPASRFWTKTRDVACGLRCPENGLFPILRQSRLSP
jgi:hypothetical protein